MHAGCDTADAVASCYDAVILPPNHKKTNSVGVAFSVPVSLSPSLSETVTHNDILFTLPNAILFVGSNFYEFILESGNSVAV